ncbi:MAG TPA: methionyl-tRNA formyltransferase [Microbacteriaceae bacterium]|nr:methionyl-tRNA formyltransferase [Microbacteriaceae bacterium]
MTMARALKGLRIVFAGTPEVAVPALRRLAAGRHRVVGVLTRPDAPLGRRRTPTASAVAREAALLGLPVVTANRPDETTARQVHAWAPDLGVIVAYGGLLRQPLLDVPAHGWINLHFSALPRWRGAAPVQRAILAGERATALDVFRLVPALDAGEILASRSQGLPADETAGQALERFAGQGAGLLEEVVDAIARGDAAGRPQEGDATYATKLTRDDGRLDWARPAAEIYNRFRAVTPEPGAFTTLAGQTVKIHDMRRSGAHPGPAPDPAALAAGEARGIPNGVLVGTGTTPLLLVTLQPAGKRAMPAEDWWRGHGRAGLRLG